MRNKMDTNHKTSAKKERVNYYAKRVGEFFGRNYLIFAYIIAAVLCELFAICATTGKFYMSSPWLFLSIVAVMSLIAAFIPSNKARYIFFLCVLAMQFILDLVFIIVYECTHTIFDFAMLSLRNDAMLIVESLPVNFLYVFASGVIVASYCVFGWLLREKFPAPVKHARLGNSLIALALAVIIGAHAGVVYVTNESKINADLKTKLYGTDVSSYSDKGVMANFVNELYRGTMFDSIDIGDIDELSEFIYAKETEKTAYSGVARGYNVVNILCESFEWFTFLKDETRYPNGHTASKEQLRELFPNLYDIYYDDSTVVLNNSHALEKTDISENKSLIGNYPMYKFINYDYCDNTLPYSLPNIYENVLGGVSNSFHNGLNAFYNRNVHMVNALGFDSFTSSEMYLDDASKSGLGEKNLDSDLIEYNKEKMFPTDKPFFTQITTITQHGQYSYRKNLEWAYEKMDEVGVCPLNEDGTIEANNENVFRYYVAAGMELDKAIGIMLDYLDEKGLSDNTIITLYGDHNAYYQTVTNYVKNINFTTDDNYTELYRTPVMIKVGDYSFPQEDRIIDKFTCVSDIYPTVLDLLGVTAYENLMYGTSAFTDEESILYSRAYDKFVTEDMYFSTLTNILHKEESVDDARLEQVKTDAEGLLDKISHVNRIFAADYFKGDNEIEFYDRLKTLYNNN